MLAQGGVLHAFLVVSACRLHAANLWAGSCFLRQVAVIEYPRCILDLLLSHRSLVLASEVHFLAGEVDVVDIFLFFDGLFGHLEFWESAFQIPMVVLLSDKRSVQLRQVIDGVARILERIVEGLVGCVVPPRRRCVRPFVKGLVLYLVVRWLGAAGFYVLFYIPIAICIGDIVAHVLLVVHDHSIHVVVVTVELHAVEWARVQIRENLVVNALVALRADERVQNFLPVIWLPSIQKLLFVFTVENCGQKVFIGQPRAKRNLLRYLEPGDIH